MRKMVGGSARPNRFAVLCRMVSILAISVGVAGCGESRPGRDSYPVERGKKRLIKYPIEYTPGGLRILVRERMPGGYLVISAKRYMYRGHTYSVLQNQEEELARHVLGMGSNGPNIGLGEHEALEMEISSGCVGSHVYALAYGMLRNPKDSVTAETHGTTIRFRKVVVPTNFHPDGVLVLAQLGQGPTNIVTRAPNGRVVRSEPYDEREALPCERR
jgi:hypothetical protein